MKELPFKDVPIGGHVILRYETFNTGVKVSDDTVEFDSGGFLSSIRSEAVRAFAPSEEWS